MRIGLAASLWAAVAAAAPAWADEGSAYASDTPSGAIGGRYYLSPTFTYTLADAGRLGGNGYGGAVAVGRQWSPVISLEFGAQFSELKGRGGREATQISGYGFNTLFFPAQNAGYLLLGAAYGQVSEQPGPVSSYSPLLLNVGAGYLLGPFGKYRWSLRSEALWRLDAHNDRRTGDTRGNGRKAFDDAVFGLGLVLPLGAATEATTAMQAPPVEENPAQLVEMPDADGAGVLDDDNLPGPPAADDTSPAPADSR